MLYFYQKSYVIDEIYGGSAENRVSHFLRCFFTFFDATASSSPFSSWGAPTSQLSSLDEEGKERDTNNNDSGEEKVDTSTKECRIVETNSEETGTMAINRCKIILHKVLQMEMSL